MWPRRWRSGWSPAGHRPAARRTAQSPRPAAAGRRCRNRPRPRAAAGRRWTGRRPNRPRQAGQAHASGLRSNDAGPARQVARLGAVRQAQGLMQGLIGQGNIALATAQVLGCKARAEKIGPEEFDERRSVLGIATGLAHGAGQAAVGVVAQAVQLLGHLGPVAAAAALVIRMGPLVELDRKSTRLNSSHSQISYAVFCLKKKSLETGRVTV